MATASLKKKFNFNHDFDEARIQRALDFTNEQYAIHYKDEPTFPLEFLEIILPLRPDEETVISLFLHKLYLDDFVKDEEIEKMFGKDVLAISKGAKKLHNINYVDSSQSSQIEALRKMVFVLAKDLRVILIGLACRLYRLRYLDKYISKEKQIIFAKECMNIFAPLAARLGIYSIKGELEDLAFKYINPNAYSAIFEQLKNFQKSNIAFVKSKLEKFLKSKGIKAEVSGRMKGIYSIYKKMNLKGLNTISDFYDIFAMRIIVPAKKTVDHLYGILGLIHTQWTPISKKFKDYIAVAKPNGYRSLHTVVLGLSQEDTHQPVEIQIRDSDMHRDSEYGIASHWLYKDSSSLSVSIEDWIKGLESIRDTTQSDIELDMFKDRIFVLTPKGEVKDLPFGAVPVDFAYAVHSDLGNRCAGAKVNGIAVPLDSELHNGDVVEIITRKSASPNSKWMSFVKTGDAKHKIKSWLSSQNKENNLREGKILINEQLERIGKPALDQTYSILKKYLGNDLTLARREALIEEIGAGGKAPKDVIKKIYPYEEYLGKLIRPKNEPRKAKVSLANSLKPSERVLVGGERGLSVKFATCCKPKTGDSIIGFITRGKGATLHKISCRLLKDLDHDRFIQASWSEGSPRYLIGIKLYVVSRLGLMRDVTSVISGMGMSIRDASMRTPRKGMPEERFLVEFDDLDQFDKLIDKLENVSGVVKVVKDNSFKTKII